MCYALVAMHAFSERLCLPSDEEVDCSTLAAAVEGVRALLDGTDILGACMLLRVQETGLCMPAGAETEVSSSLSSITTIGSAVAVALCWPVFSSLVRSMHSLMTSAESDIQYSGRLSQTAGDSAGSRLQSRRNT